MVPESIMSDSGIAQRVRQQLIEEMNLHTVVRLPKGVFEPYSDIQTNLLFFDTSGPTKGVWYYQHELPEPRRSMRDPKYTKTFPLRYEELDPVLEWSKNKKPTASSWFVSREELVQSGFSLDFRNPTRAACKTLALPDLLASIGKPVGDAAQGLRELSAAYTKIAKLSPAKWERHPLSDMLDRVRVEAEVDDAKPYKQITVRLYGKGVVERAVIQGRDIKTRPQFRAHAGDLIMSRIDARNGAFGIIPSELDGALVTQDFPMFRIDPSKITPEYLALLLKSDEFTQICKRASRGTTNRKRLKEDLFLAELVPVPPLAVQEQLVRFAKDATILSHGARFVAERADDIEQNICNLMLAP